MDKSLKPFTFVCADPTREDIIIYAPDSRKAWLELDELMRTGTISYPEKRERYAITSTDEF